MCKAIADTASYVLFSKCKCKWVFEIVNFDWSFSKEANLTMAVQAHVAHVTGVNMYTVYTVGTVKGLYSALLGTMTG